MQRVVTRRRDAVMVTGWPSFSDLMKEESITKADDFSYGMHRVEATCSQVNSSSTAVVYSSTTRSSVCHRADTDRHLFNPAVNVELPVNPTCMSLDCGRVRNPGYMERTQANAGRTCRRHTESLQPVDSNPESSCCEVPTTTLL